MPTYSLDLDGPYGQLWIEEHFLADEVRRGDRFEYRGWVWEILEVATSQERPQPVLRCVAV